MSGPPAARPAFAVIICAYTLDRWQEIVAAVGSVCRQTLPPLEVLVVIDGNSQLLERARAELEEGPVRVVPNHYRDGLSGARQTGAELATAPLLAFLDDDAVAEPEWLQELAPAYDDPQALGAGGVVEPLWQAREPRWLPPELYWIIGCTYAGMPVHDGRIRNPIGANMSVRAEVLARAGTFETSLGRIDRGGSVMGSAEETEFCIRAARMHPGGYWAYRPRARVRHSVPASRATLAYFAHRCDVEGTAKADLIDLAGGEQGLASERAYTRSVLPRAFVRELRAALHGRPEGLERAAIVVLGLALTARAYAWERGRRRWQARRARPA
jgi:glucosyl-dolichyl phosphate glucuronosyltransferase